MVDVYSELMLAVCEDDIGTLRRLISSFGLHHSRAWSGGYFLLRKAMELEHNKVAKELLLGGSKVNNKSEKHTDTPLHLSVYNGDIEIVDMLLDRGAEIYAINHRGMTPLNCAAQIGHVTIVERLLNHGADVNYIHYGLVNCDRYTPLHCACGQRDERIVALLLSHGAGINKRTANGSTALHIAAWQRNEKHVKLLLDHGGADVNSREYTKDGRTICEIAVHSRDRLTLEHILESRPDVNIEDKRSLLLEAIHQTKFTINGNMVNTLVKYGFNIIPEDANDVNLLHAAVTNDHLSVVEDLLKYGAHVHLSRRFGTGSTVLHSAAINKNTEMAKLLIQYGIDVNAKNNENQTPLFLSIEKQNVNMTKLLLFSGANIYDEHDHFCAAIKSNCVEMVDLIFQHSSDLDMDALDSARMTPSHYVVNVFGIASSPHSLRYSDEKNHKDLDLIKGKMVKFCLSRGASVDVQTENACTALHAAAARGYAKVVEILLDYNADVNAVNETDGDKTPLYYSAAVGWETICKMLLENGAEVNVKEKINKSTALHVACKNRCGNLVKLLLAFGAEINCRDTLNQTPLHIAVSHNNLEVVDILLIQFCAEVDSTDKDGKTPLHVAAEMDHCQVAAFLLDCGSDINATCNNGLTPLKYVPTPDHSTIRILKQHIGKINALNLFVSDENLRYLDSHEDLKIICKNEVNKLKSTNINDSIVSFKNVLTKSIMQVAMYARNESIVKVLESSDYKKIFPIYFSMIQNRFRKGEKLESLLSPATKAFSYLFGFDLPEVYSMQLFSYLSINDLKNLIEAGAEAGQEECVN